MNLKNSLYKVEPSSFNKKILLPASKSHANRALIIGAIKGNGFKITNLSESSDVITMLNCLKSVGLQIDRIGDSVIFKNSFPACESASDQQIIDLASGDGGTTNRFLLALLSRGKKTYRFFPTEKMNERPIDDLIKPLKKLNVEIVSNANGAWLSVRGPANVENTGRLEIDCQKSTQFASAMMLAFSPLPLVFELKNIKASEKYILMTKMILKETLLGNSYTVPADFSSLGYPLALALIKPNSKVLIKNIKTIDPLQADAELIELMQKSGADIQWTKNGLLATSKNMLLPFDVDGSKFPDLIPTLVFLASYISGKSVIRNLSILRHKESDRLEQLLKLLKVFAVTFHFDESNDVLFIEGSAKIISPVTLHPARDHRMVMISYLFLRANQGGLLAETDCVEKSFPGFFNIM